MKRKYYLILSLAELIFFLVAAISIARGSKLNFNYDQSAIFADSADGRVYGTELNQDNSQDISALQTEEMSLDKGIYEITVVYAATDGGTVHVSGDGKGPRSIWADDVGLSKNNTETTFRIWANDPLERFRVQITSGGGTLSVREIVVKTADNSQLYRIVCVLLKLMLVNLLAAAYYLRKRLQKYSVEIVGISAITLIASIALLTRYILPGHDLIFHLLRIEGLKDGLLSGAFPVRIQPNWCNGWGYAVSIMYGDTTLFLPAVMRMLGFTVQTSYKTFVIALNFATAGIAFYSFYKISKNKYYALLGSLLYTTAPYRLCCIYIRGAFGEYVAMMFLPLIALGFWYAFTENVESDDYGKKIVAPVIGFSGVIQTHILTCQMAAIFIVLLCLIMIKKVFRKRTFLYLLKILLITILANLWFLIPFLRYFGEELNATSFNDMAADYQVLGVSITELLAQQSSGYYGYSWSELTSLANKFSIPFSNGLLLCAVFGLLCIWNNKLSQKKEASIVLVMGSLSVWLATNLFPYHAIQVYLPKAASFLAKPGLPYRYLSLACLLLSLFAVIMFKGLDREKIRDNMAAIVFCVIMAVGVHQSVGFSYDTLYSGMWAINYDAVTLSTTNLMGNEYLYRGSETWITDIDRVAKGQNIHIQESKKWYNHMEVTCEAAGEDAYLEVPMFYYPGYIAYATEDVRHRLELQRGDNNRIRVTLPENFSGKVVIEFKEPVIWRAAEVISLITMLGLSINWGYRRRFAERRRLKLKTE